MKINRLIHIALFMVFSTSLNAQVEAIDQRWKQLQERINYEQSRRPKGPEGNYIDPPYFEQGSYSPENVEYYEDISSEDIEASRAQRFPTGTGNSGVRERIRKGEGIHLEDIDRPDVTPPEIDAPDWDGPDWDGPDYDPSTFNTDFWKTFLIIFAILLLSFLIYLVLVRNKDTDGVGKKSLHDSEDWDPTEVELDELTQKLNEALARNDYRSCIRIYYTLILKELIEKQWIQWEKKKTNLHYLLEMEGRKERAELEKSIRIFELVWYGDYAIAQEEYQEVAPHMNLFYQELKNG